jgi:hypothetical protein
MLVEPPFRTPVPRPCGSERIVFDCERCVEFACFAVTAVRGGDDTFESCPGTSTEGPHAAAASRRAEHKEQEHLRSYIFLPGEASRTTSYDSVLTTRTHTQTHTRSHARTHTQTHTRSHVRTLTQARTRTHTHAHTRSYTHSHPHYHHPYRVIYLRLVCFQPLLHCMLCVVVAMSSCAQIFIRSLAFATES